MLAVSPSLTHSGHTRFLVLPFPRQAYSCLSASAHAVSSAWNTFPWLSPRLTPAICSGLCSDVYHRGFPRSLFKKRHGPDPRHSPISLPSFTFFALAFIIPGDFLFMHLFMACLPPPGCKLHEGRNDFSIHCYIPGTRNSIWSVVGA